LFHLGAGRGGLATFCERYGDSFHRWWEDLGAVNLDSETVSRLVSGVQEEAAGKEWQELCERRDALIVSMLKATSRFRPR
jgi:carnitine 3-dehydrogenase